MCFSLRRRQIFNPCPRSLSLSFIRLGSYFYQISQTHSLQAKRIRLFLKNILNPPKFSRPLLPTNQSPSFLQPIRTLNLFINQQPLFLTHNVKFLGLILDSQLNFDNQIEHIANKLSPLGQWEFGKVTKFFT